MKPYRLPLEHILALVRPKLTPEMLRKLDAPELHVPEIVFTALDGDDEWASDDMADHVLQKNKVPVNPMILLSTYIAAEHYKQKLPIIRLCWRLTEFVDDFYLMTRSKITSLEDLFEVAEGAVAEIAAWLMRTQSQSLRFVNFETGEETVIPINIDEFKERLITVHGDVPEESMAKRHGYPYLLSEILTRAHTKIPVEYVLTERKDFRHLRHVNLNAFHHDKIALIPEFLLGTPLRYPEADQSHDMLSYRLALALRCDTVCIYMPKPKHEFKLSDLSDKRLIELAFIRKFKPDVCIYYQDLNNMLVKLPENSETWDLRSERLAKKSRYESSLTLMGATTETSSSSVQMLDTAREGQIMLIP